MRALRLAAGAAIVVVLTLGGGAASAQMYKPDSNDAVPGKELFRACGFCHGDQGQGRQRLDAPPLAGMAAWYVERQLHNLKAGIRGTHPEDLPGAQMQDITGMLRNDATIRSVAAYIETLKPGAPPMSLGGDPKGPPEPLVRPFVWHSRYAALQARPGDVAAGRKLYQAACTACHGAMGEGNKALNAPKLTGLPGWYAARELKYFRDGVRGSNPKDIFGAQMAASAGTLKDEQAIADVLAYIDTF